MRTAKNLRFQKGDFVHTGLFPGIIIGDVRMTTPTCEVWGFEHELGSAFAEELTPLSWMEFETMAKQYGFDGTAYSQVAKDAIRHAVSAFGDLARAATATDVNLRSEHRQAENTTHGGI